MTIAARLRSLISAVKWGYLFQGQHASGSRSCAGSSTFGVPAARFVTYLENHDQVANSARGFRLKDLPGPGCYRAMAALWLLAPQTPLFFQGQELGTSRPFVYFCDHVDPLASLVRKGRVEELAGFRSTLHPDLAALIADVPASTGFQKSKLEDPVGYQENPVLPSLSGPPQAEARGPDLPGSTV